MALTISSKISVCPVSSERTFSSDSIRCQSIYQGLHIRDSKNGNVSPKLCLYKHESWINNGNHSHSCGFQKSPFLCLSNGTHHSEAPKGWYSDRTQEGHLNAEELFDSSPDTHSVLHERTFTSSSDGLSEAFRFVHNDAKFVNEKAHNDIILLSRGIARLDNRARQDFAILGSGFLKLDARAREDTEKIDNGVKERAARLKGLALNLKEKAESKLKSVADKHWSDGALEADLRRADFCFRRRAMEDAYMALEFVRNIHDMMVSRMHLTSSSQGSHSANEMLGLITLEKNGKAYDIFSGRLSADRITALQEVYWSMASALSEADGIDYTDPEELELLVSTLIDLDAMDGKRSVSLLAECSSSPDVSMRKALANALATAPSMWTLGNAGMGALQRLAEDSNPAVAAAASRAISELQRQWEVAEGDNLRFTLNQGTYTDEDSDSLK